MRKLLYLFIVILLTGCKSNTILFDLDEYKDISLDNIISIEKVRYTEGGDDSNIYTAPDDIYSIYNSLKETKLGRKTNLACEDNTTVYIINMNDNTKKTITFECEVLVVGNTRYLIK